MIGQSHQITGFQKSNGALGTPLDRQCPSPRGGLEACAEVFCCSDGWKYHWHYGRRPRTLDLLQAWGPLSRPWSHWHAGWGTLEGQLFRYEKSEPEDRDLLAQGHTVKSSAGTRPTDVQVCPVPISPDSGSRTQKSLRAKEVISNGRIFETLVKEAEIFWTERRPRQLMEWWC